MNGDYKICNIPSNCSRSECYSGCVIDVMIKRLYELEHDKNQKDKSKHEFLSNVNPYHNPSDTFIHCKKVS